MTQEREALEPTEADIPSIIERGARGERLTPAEHAAWQGYELGWRDGRRVAREEGRRSTPGDVEAAFDLGFAWRGMLVSQTLEDGRAVGRTLASSLFDGLDLSDAHVPAFVDAEIAICEAKAAIKRKLAALLPILSEDEGAQKDGGAS